ncbi:glutathione peroxidase [Hymenobacter luteus]|uniref:Glutathione peroxidase n=2 Tax=Hymenobacter TaxID=89966 RepID=A0A7W9SZ93_9BACT|nr:MULTISPECIES: glutathione peroxidase [Hymenobacter]MBB4601126.1 glutathione peroxidase [Hymenobacter latericoloratus]MBB6058667.1 glutathione peroxidase [Hymenobacter luteus]
MSSFRQKLLKALYPLIMKLSKSGSKGKVLRNEKPVSAPVPFYNLAGQLNSGRQLNFDELRGKKVLVVNTASNCGYTNQYEELQQLSEQFADQLVVLGFPANDFAEQEKADDKTIEQFCQVNFGVSFPLMKKSVVVKKGEQNPVYQWLSNARQNGWNEQAPDWNFSKYLISEDGRLTHYFGPAVSPLSDTVINTIKTPGQKS